MKRTNRAAANENFKVATENSLAGLFIIQDGKFKYVNPAMSRSLGYSPMELVQKVKPLEMIHPDDRKMVAGFYQKRITGKKVPSDYTCKVLRKDGTPAYYRLFNRSIKYKGKNAIVGTAVDVTHSKQFVDNARERSERAASFLQNFDGIVMQGTLDHKPLLATGKVKEITGYEPAEFLAGKVFWENLIVPEDGHVVKKTIREIKKAGFSDERSYRIRRKDGSIRWVHEKIHNVCDYSGKPAIIQGMITDVTEQHKVEEALRTSATLLHDTFNAIPDLIAVVDRNLRVVMSNWHGHAFIKNDEKNGMPFCYKVFRHETKHCKCCDVQRTFKTGNTQLSVVNNPVDNTTREVRTYPVYDSQGKVVLVVEHVRNITKEKQAQEYLKESEEKFRTLAEESPSMIFINQDGHLVYCNPKCLEMGYTLKEFYSPRFDFMKLVSPETKKIVMENYAKHLRGAVTNNYEATHIKKNGRKIRTITTTKNIQYHGKKAILGIITKLTDKMLANKMTD